MFFAGIILYQFFATTVLAFCYCRHGRLLHPIFMRLSRPCDCVFCPNLVHFLLLLEKPLAGPQVVFATTVLWFAATSVNFCYHRLLDFSGTNARFFPFATTSVSICWNKLQFLLPSGFRFVGTASVFSNFATNVLLVFAGTVKNF